MMENAILPADVYQVINRSIITEEDIKILNLLYLPIIGSLAVSLYQMLINDLHINKMDSSVLTHSHLLSYLHVSNEELLEARSCLEGIGLIKSYLKKDSVNKYIYELYSPVSSHEFFNHPIFNIVLYNNVGKKEYDRLVSLFRLSKISKDGYVEITRRFDSVFESVPYTSFDIYQDNLRKRNKLKLNIDSSFDINLLIETMPKQIDKKIFTKDLQELIVSLAYLYDIDNTKMQNIVKSCLNEKGNVNKEELRKTARNHYQFDNSGVLPTIIQGSKSECSKKVLNDNSKLAKMIYTFENTHPYDFLKSKYKNSEPVKRDIMLLEDLIVKYKLAPGVVNVLIDYVLKTKDNKLTRNYVETIAGEWARKKIDNVMDAMDIARKNHSQNKFIKNTSKSLRKEVPVWFDQNILSSEASSDELREMEEMLKEYR